MPSTRPHPRKAAPLTHPTAQLQVVDPRWLLKAIGVCLIGALLCGYATLCLLYYQGAWQLLLHPSRNISSTPASLGVPYTDIRFDAAETGQPRLTGWWIPVDSTTGTPPRYADFTILYLHDGSGSLSTNLPTLALLHSAGINVFAFDYRGFGASDASDHPTADRMNQDAEAALNYLTSTRHIPLQTVIPYGTGLGASLAANLARQRQDLPVVLLDNPNPDPGSTIAAQSPSYIPARLLVGHPFDIATSITTLTTPKLLLSGGPNSSDTYNQLSLQTLIDSTASPKFVVALPTANYQGQYDDTLHRFLDEYLKTGTH